MSHDTTQEPAYQTPEEAEARAAGTDNGVPPGASALWPEGNYTGTFLRSNITASAQKGTPGIQLYFQVEGKQVCVECWLTEATLAGMTGDQLRLMGWNGEYTEGAEFAPPDPVPLWMKHDTYKGAVRERWNISAKAAASPAAVASLDRARLLWKAKAAAPAPVPAAAPKAPPRAAAPTPAKPAPAAKAPAPPPRPKAPKKPEPKPEVAPAYEPKPVTTLEQAWEHWVSVDCDDADAFWKAVETVKPGSEDLSAAEWQAVADAAPIPF